ncbi:MAG: CtsR family transcriptional regulator [Oscillospiraceae bacterium]|nr:CtsR family transcriptional regulator [Oscillospiraceae bacterium]
MGTSDLIADFITEILENADGPVDIRRSGLAERFSCAPSQINYVISTRFSPEHGYAVESRRGGGGYIRITRVRVGPTQLIMHTINAVGGKLDYRTAVAFVSNIVSAGAVGRETAELILTAVGDNALRPLEQGARDIVRASIFKQMLITLISK